MTIINTSPDRSIQLGYEGEDRVTVLRFRYGADWLENGEGIFHIRVRRHGEHTAYNAALVTEDPENNCLLMTVTNTELSVKGSGEMQVVYSGENFVKKSPIYSYNVSRAVDEVADPPAQDVYTQIIESLSDLQTDVSGITGNIGDLSALTTTAKTDLVSAINEVNSKSVDDVLSATSTNPVQNKVLTARINSLDSDVGTLRTSVQSKADIQTVSALADAVQGLDSDVQGLQTAVQAKADTSTVTALSGTVSGLQTAVQSKADAQTVTALSGTVTDLQTSKADKSYVDAQLSEKASAQTVSDLSDDVSDLQTSKADKTYVDVKLDGKASTQTVSDLVDDVYDIYPTDTASGVIANFPDGANSVPVKNLTVAIEPVQDLHGYDSPWPAGGGANRWDEVWEVGGIDSIGNNSPGSATIRSKNYIAVSSETSYYYYNGDGITAGLRFYDSNKEYIGNAAGTANISFTTPSGTAYMRFVVLADYGTTYKNNIAINYPSTTTTYFPYSNICPITGWTGAKVTVNEDVLDITFPSEAGTVYGGTLDVVNGVLTVDRAMVDLGTLDWRYYPNSGKTKYYFRTLNEIIDAKLSDGGIPNCISDRYKVSSWSITVDNTASDNCITFGWSGKSYIAVCDSAYSDASAFKTAMSGVQLVYELATPITYQLTPQEVSTLLGQNNIWADAGDTTVEYRANTSAYIAKKIAEAISALS